MKYKATMELDEIADIIIDLSNKLDEIWNSEDSYLKCSEAALREYASAVGKISAKLTALKIRYKYLNSALNSGSTHAKVKGNEDEEKNNNIYHE